MERTGIAVAPDARSVVEEKVRMLLRAMADLAGRVGALRVAEAEGGLSSLIQVWPAAELMPGASAERRRRANGARSQCRADILAAVRSAAAPLTRKQVLREAGTPHGAGTVARRWPT